MKARLFTVVLVSMIVCFGVAGNRTARVTGNDASSDSTISVIAWFAKGDTMKYRYVSEEFKIKNDTDTLKNDKEKTEEFMLVVTDSTSNGYTIEFIPGKTEYGGREMSDDVSKNTLKTLTDMFKETRAVFTTNDVGTIIGIKNWKEIRDKMKDGFTLMLDSMYKVNPGLDSVMPRARYETLLKLVYSSEKGIMSAYDEISMLFGLHGNVFNIGTTKVDDSEKDSTVTTVFAGYEAYDDYSFEDDYTIGGKSETRLTRDETVELVGNVFGMLLQDSIADKTRKVLQDSLNAGVTVTQLEDYNFFYNGWPCAMRTCKIVKFADIKTVKSKSLVWTYRSWREFDAQATKPEGVSM